MESRVVLFHFVFICSFFLYRMKLVNFLNFSIAYILLLFLFYYYIFVRFERSVFNFDHHCQIILVIYSERRIFPFFFFWLRQDKNS